MSRVAKAPVVVPAGVDVKINGQVITIKGKNGELTRTLNDAVEVKHADNTLTFPSAMARLVLAWICTTVGGTAGDFKEWLVNAVSRLSSASEAFIWFVRENKSHRFDLPG